MEIQVETNVANQMEAWMIEVISGTSISYVIHGHGSIMW